MYQRNFWILYSGLEPRDDGSAIGPPPANFSEILERTRNRRPGIDDGNPVSEE
jgi:hypothetical protein